MKKLFLLVVCSFFTHTTFAQSERDQKIQKVQEKQSQRTNVNNNNTNYNQGYQNGYDNGVRNNRYSTPYYYNPYDVGYYPYWNINRRWDRREYLMTTDTDLIQRSNSKPTRLSFGVIVERDKFQSQMSPYIITGGETFMVIQYHTTLPLIYPYYDNISTWEVEDWGDTRKVYNSYYNELYVLSSIGQNGIYLINQQILTNMSIRGGFLYHWNYLELMMQVRFDGRFGIGGGVGIKL